MKINIKGVRVAFRSVCNFVTMEFFFVRHLMLPHVDRCFHIKDFTKLSIIHVLWPNSTHTHIYKTIDNTCTHRYIYNIYMANH